MVGTRSDDPAQDALSGHVGGGWLVVAAGEGEEGIGSVRGVIVPGPVLPHAPALVPLLPVRPKPPQPKITALLVELAAGKGRPRRRDRLELVARSLDDGGMEPERTHHPLG